MLGFIDLYIRLELKSLNYTDPFNENFEKDERIEEIPHWCQTSGNYRVSDDNIAEHHFYCDVRASIPSFGELMRQIRFIQEELPHQGINSHYVVVSPNTEYEDLLLDEGIYFIAYQI